MKGLSFFLYACFFLLFGMLHAEEFVLKNNLRLAKPGDYLVVSCNKTLTLMHISAKSEGFLTIEEIAVPENQRSSAQSWKDWVAANAPGNTSWVTYDIDLGTGQMSHYYSYTKKNWYEIPEADNFLSKLLTLKLVKIPEYERKRIGSKSFSSPDMRPFWQPRMMVEGKAIEGILFDAWKTDWPTDGSELSNKTIEVYLPKNHTPYPSYFPYWLQVNGVAGKAKIRVIDTGSHLQSPKRSKTTDLKQTEKGEVINNEVAKAEGKTFFFTIT